MGVQQISDAGVQKIDQQVIKEFKAKTLRGVFALLGLIGFLALFGCYLWLVISGASDLDNYNSFLVDNSYFAFGVVKVVLGSIFITLWIFLFLTSIVVVQPGQTSVRTFFGRYIGTVRRDGLALVMPFSLGKKVSVRVRNFETNTIKVNDLNGNPINIAAIVVWQVKDTACAIFAVENYEKFVSTQAEAALRHVASSHPYDDLTGKPGVISLLGDVELVSKELAEEVADRVSLAGVEVVEVRISALAYAPEIAQVMLQRQQAGAVIAAREKIVEGAVSMVNDALSRLETENIVNLDDERRAQMVSNLLVVLCSESHATPVVNAGSLYS